MRLHACLSVCLPICRSVYLPAYLFICLLPICLFASLSACLSVCLPTCLPFCLPIFLSICLSACLPESTHACLSVLYVIICFILQMNAYCATLLRTRASERVVGVGMIIYVTTECISLSVLSSEWLGLDCFPYLLPCRSKHVEVKLRVSRSYVRVGCDMRHGVR